MMQRGGGVILNVVSNEALRPSIGIGVYAPSKAALMNLSVLCAKHWARDGIRVCSIAPGLIRTELARPLVEAVESSGQYPNPQKRIGEPEEAEIAEMKAGSVCLFAGSIFHGGGPNTTDDTRDGLIIAYCANWLRQEENQYLSVSREAATKLDEPLQRLLGYDQLYALGYWGDEQHPLEYLGGKPSGPRLGGT